MKIHLIDDKGNSSWYEDIGICHVTSNAQDTVVSAIEQKGYIQIRSSELQVINASKTI